MKYVPMFSEPIIYQITEQLKKSWIIFGPFDAYMYM